MAESWRSLAPLPSSRKLGNPRRAEYQRAYRQGTSPLAVERLARAVGLSAQDYDGDALILAIDTLPEQQAMALKLRYGMGRLTLKQVGQRLPRVRGGSGLTGERARQIIAVALRRLRHPSRRRGYLRDPQPQREPAGV